jgi:hypothetical protein
MVKRTTWVIIAGAALLTCLGIVAAVMIWGRDGRVSYDRFEYDVLDRLSKDPIVASRLGTPVAFRKVDSAPGIHPKPGELIPGDIYAKGVRSLLGLEEDKEYEAYCALFIEGAKGNGTAGVRLLGDRKGGKIISLAVEYADRSVTTLIGPAIQSVEVNASVTRRDK